MSSLRTRVSQAARDPERFPTESDEALGQALLARVEALVAESKLPRPALLLFGPEQVTQVDLLPVQQTGANMHRFIAACTRVDLEVDVVALVGVMGLRLSRDSKQSIPAAMVFLERPDCRWWSAQRVLKEKKLSDELPARLRSAEEGWPRPGGLGGWWSRGRYEGLQLKLHRDTPTVH
jgi:hypothetical protein